MELKIYQIDAFTERLFGGNPAAVVPLEKWLPDSLMQKIAMENNLSETAFFIVSGEKFHIRWFTPATEVNLCGHATLASAHVIFNHLNYNNKEMEFKSRSGILKVKNENGLIVLNFPASYLNEIDIPENMEQAFGLKPEKYFEGTEDNMLVFNDEDEIKNLQPDFSYIKTLGTRGIIVTAPSEEFDFVSRFFAPQQGIDEDPVTGSAHTMLIPYWSARLGKQHLKAKQISARGGILYCTFLGERVEIGGKAITYFAGNISV